MMNNEQLVLLQKLKEGSYKAFEALYAEYFDLLYGFVYQLTYSHDLTEEIVQEVYIKVWTNREKIDLNLSFKAWLYKIAKNKMLDIVKHQLHAPLFEDYLDYCSNEALVVNSDEGNFDFDVFKQSLQKATAQLSPRQQEVFKYCKEDGLSTKDVATKLQISEQAVYNYLSQALSILRKNLGSYYFKMFLFLLMSRYQ